MIYLIAFLGLAFGFICGQILLYFLLADFPDEEIKKNKKIRLHYGLLNWAVAFVGMLSAVYFFG